MHGLVEGTTTPSSAKAAAASPIIARGATIKVSSPIHAIVMKSINKAVGTPSIPSRRIFHREQKSKFERAIGKVQT